MTCAGCGETLTCGRCGPANAPVFLGYACGCLGAWDDAVGHGESFTKVAEWAAARRKQVRP